MPHSPKKRISPIKQEPDIKPYGNRFECQPEYRRAYIDYIQREQIDRLRPAEDVPGIHKADKAFEVLCTKGTAAEEKRLEGPIHVKIDMVNGDVAR